MELRGSKTEANLITAFSGESQATNKYTYYASKAKSEGYGLSRPGCSVVKWTGGFVGRSRTRMSGGRGE